MELECKNNLVAFQNGLEFGRDDSTDSVESLLAGLSGGGEISPSVFESGGDVRQVSTRRRAGSMDIEPDRAADGRDL